jgi:phosphatidylserine/phosphatidylglycerophosphate/cardiolipin synthase-like enzyme
MEITRSDGPTFRPEITAFSSFQKKFAGSAPPTLSKEQSGDTVDITGKRDGGRTPGASKSDATKDPARDQAIATKAADKPADQVKPARTPGKQEPLNVNVETGTITCIEPPRSFAAGTDLPVNLSDIDLSSTLATEPFSALDIPVSLMAAKAEKKEFRGIKSVAKDLRELRKISKEIAKNPEITAGDESLKDASARIKEIHKEIHAEAISSGMSDALSEQLVQAHLVLMDLESAKDRIRAMHVKIREEKLKEIAGDKIDAVSLEYFRRTANVRPEEMKEILDRIAEINTPGSKARIEGNKVETLHREQIWQTKMQLLDEALKNPVKNGKPIEIDVEYYEFSSDEMIERIKAALDAGCAVRVLMDPGHIVGDASKGFDISPVASRVRTISSLFSGTKETNLGVALFPIIEFLGQRDELMHRKFFRVGDKVILGGMNANTGSGENVDAAQHIEGPAAKELVKIYQRDVGDSSKTDLESIYGPQVLEIIGKGTYTGRDGEAKEVDRFITSRGMRDLLDVASIELGIDLPKGDIGVDAVNALEEELTRRGHTLRKLCEFYDVDGDGKVTDDDIAQFLSGSVEARTGITKQGGKLFSDLVSKAVERVNGKQNREHLGDISLPKGEKTGAQTVVLGDAPVEREALILNAIQSAEKFIYIPTFVMTENIAGALAVKKEEMKAEGKDIDIKVVIDSGLYPHGGTPNEAGYKALENAGIPVKWSMMWRTSSDHARKIHAKELLTDKMEVSGSTNFSEKALRKNWELSGATYFNDDPQSIAMRDAAVKDFNQTWRLESIDIDTRALAEKKYADVKTEDVKYRKKEYRGRLIIKFLREIERFSKQVGRMMDEVRQKPELQREAQKLMEQGMNEGYAFIKAIMEKYTEAELKAIAEKLSGWQSLEAMRTGESLPEA